MYTRQLTDYSLDCSGVKQGKLSQISYNGKNEEKNFSGVCGVGLGKNDIALDGAYEFMSVV